MRVRPLIPLVLLLAACGTQRPLCPTDSTADFDATITQSNVPVVNPATSDTLSKESGRFDPASQTGFAHVRYTITIANRTDEAMRVHEITLDTPYIVGGGATRAMQCFGLDTVGAGVATTSRGFDTKIEPRNSARFEMTVSEMLSPSVLSETAKVLTLLVGIDSPRGNRSERLTRKVTLKTSRHANVS